MTRAEELMARARAQTGLDEFGEDSFREGLEILVGSLDTEAKLHEDGKAGTDGMIVGFLACRLQVEDWYRRHPEIDEQEIVAPLVGLGLPRTGSTALSALLAEDPAVRYIRTWEANGPCPPPETATEHTDPRIAQAEQQMIWRDKMFPRMKMMVPSTPTGPMECQTFMAYDFKSMLFHAQAQIPSYSQWLLYKADLVPTFRYVKRVLKLLQWRCPPTRWRLKNPNNAVFIDALDEVFPDARFWMTHRDITNVLPSVCDVYYELIKAFSNDVDRHYLGRLNTEWTELGLKRLIAFRDEKGQDHRFFDIHFAPFQRDPFPSIERLYAFLGEEFTPEARARMAAWRERMPRDKHGLHTYDMADFGLGPDRLRERYRFYAVRFSAV